MSNVTASRARSHRLAVVVALLVVATLPLAAPGAPAAGAAERTSHSLASAAPVSPSGWYRGPVDVHLRASDTAQRTEYRLDGGAWQATAGQPVRVSQPGVHTVEYRSVDAAGAVEPTRVVSFRIDNDAPELSSRVAHGADGAKVTVTADDTSAGAGASEIAYRVDGGPWQAVALEERIFDGTFATFDRWRMAGGGSFELTEEGNLQTVGGMGMLWYPERQLGNVAVRLQWRDARPDGALSNGGMFVRFPDPQKAVAYPPLQRDPCQVGLGLLYAEWSAVQCGHEIQINDASSDPQKTGSVYNFKSLDVEKSRPAPFGVWNEMEVRTVGGGSYAVTVVRNGEVINSFVNSPGQRPARAYDPPTDLRQFATGYFGLQNHGGQDTIEYRDIRVLDLAPSSSSFTVTGSGPRSLDIRATDDAGNTSVTSTTVFLP